MAEPFDVYSDGYTLAGGPYGVTITFTKSGAKPVAPGSNPPMDDVGSIRMSWEHFKLMAFLMTRQVRQTEQQFGVQIPIPVQLLSSLKIAPEDWEHFWQPLP
ncbi:MAG: hypothetical protein HY680_01460 [Chloroflexi bacterium]|nr:hypothetical protein [Chloroflexota bacterium]